jgi:hypothetical protein
MRLPVRGVLSLPTVVFRASILGRPLVNYINWNLNCILKEIKSILNSGKACYQSIQSFLSSSLLANHLKIKVHGTITLHAVLHSCENWSLIFRA